MTALLGHELFVDWPSLVCYLLIGGGGLLSGYFFLDYCRAHHCPDGHRIFWNTLVLTALTITFYLLNWVVFAVYGQAAAYAGTYSILYPAIVAGQMAAPWLLGLLLILWGRSLTRFSGAIEGSPTRISALSKAGILFLTVGFINFLIPSVYIMINTPIIRDSIFFWLGVLVNEVVFSVAGLTLMWVASMLVILSGRSSASRRQ
jgi:hypothetical protein